MDTVLFESNYYAVKRIDYTTLVVVDKAINNVLVIDDYEADLLEHEAYVAEGYTNALCSAFCKKLG